MRVRPLSMARTPPRSESRLVADAVPTRRARVSRSISATVALLALCPLFGISQSSRVACDDARCRRPPSEAHGCRACAAPEEEKRQPRKRRRNGRLVFAVTPVFSRARALVRARQPHLRPCIARGAAVSDSNRRPRFHLSVLSTKHETTPALAGDGSTTKQRGLATRECAVRARPNLSLLTNRSV